MENTYIGMMGGKKQRLESADQANFQCLHQKKKFYLHSHGPLDRMIFKMRADRTLYGLSEIKDFFFPCSIPRYTADISRLSSISMEI